MTWFLGSEGVQNAFNNTILTQTQICQKFDVLSANSFKPWFMSLLLCGPVVLEVDYDPSRVNKWYCWLIFLAMDKKVANCLDMGGAYSVSVWWIVFMVGMEFNLQPFFPCSIYSQAFGFPLSFFLDLKKKQFYFHYDVWQYKPGAFSEKHVFIPLLIFYYGVQMWRSCSVARVHQHGSLGDNYK